MCTYFLLVSFAFFIEVFETILEKYQDNVEEIENN